jgi:hypothetical protein
VKTMEEFRTFFDDELQPVLQELEAQRRGALRTAAVVGAVLLGGAVAAALVLTGGAPPVAGVVLAVAVAGLLGLLCVRVCTRGYVKEFKRRVIGGIVRFCDPGLRYEPEERVSRETFRASRIFQHRVDRYNGEDRVNGTVGATALEFSEVHAEYRTTSHDSKGRTQTQWYTIFRGLFFVADFNKDFRTVTVVLPDVAEKAFGWLGQKLQEMNFARPDLVKLEDPEFEREFVVYGEDQIEARYVLSTSLMRRILEFRRRAGGRVSLSFVGSKVHVAVPRTRDMFEPRLLSSALDFDAAADYLRDLQFALGIVEDLDLNTRIWSKQ